MLYIKKSVEPLKFYNMKNLLLLSLLAISCSPTKFAKEQERETLFKEGVLIVNNNHPKRIKITLDPELIQIAGGLIWTDNIKTGPGKTTFRVIYQKQNYHEKNNQKIFAYRVKYLKLDKKVNYSGDGFRRGKNFIANEKVSTFKDTVEIIIPKLIQELL